MPKERTLKKYIFYFLGSTFIHYPMCVYLKQLILTKGRKILRPENFFSTASIPCIDQHEDKWLKRPNCWHQRALCAPIKQKPLLVNQELPWGSEAIKRLSQIVSCSHLERATWTDLRVWSWNFLPEPRGVFFKSLGPMRWNTSHNQDTVIWYTFKSHCSACLIS